MIEKISEGERELIEKRVRERELRERVALDVPGAIKEIGNRS